MGRQCRRKEDKKNMVFRVRGNSDCERSATYGRICSAHDPINHENQNVLKEERRKRRKERRCIWESISAGKGIKGRIRFSLIVAILTAVATRPYVRICSAHDPINKEPQISQSVQCHSSPSARACFKDALCHCDAARCMPGSRWRPLCRPPVVAILHPRQTIPIVLSFSLRRRWQ